MKKEQIQTFLQRLSKEEGLWIGQNCVVFDETDSTNIQAAALAEDGAPHGTLVIAEAQTAGRGRRGRTWVSGAGQHIYMSLLLRPQIQPANASMLTLVMGLAAARACHDMLKEMGCQEADAIGIKWPNDLVWEGRKICGILTEMKADQTGICSIVIGIGINVNGLEFPGELQKTAASLRMAAGKELSREELVARTLIHFAHDYDVFLQTEDLKGLQEAYNQFLVNVHREVRVLDPGNEYVGIARGINEQGELLVECQGEIRCVYAGEVSVRGIYGYV